MENELRYYLGEIKNAMQYSEEEQKEIEKGAMGRTLFKPSYMVTAVKLPTGAIELAVNTENIAEKIDYILEAYDDDMHLKTDKAVVMQNLMIV